MAPCPACRNCIFYRLADGRLICASCEKPPRDQITQKLLVIDRRDGRHGLVDYETELGEAPAKRQQPDQCQPGDEPEADLGIPIEVGPLDHAVPIEDCIATPAGYFIPDRTHDPSPEAIDRFWESIRDSDRAYLLSFKGDTDDPPHGAIKTDQPCQNCRSKWVLDIAIHEGQSVRRDCAKCGAFLAFTVWYSNAQGKQPTTRTDDGCPWCGGRLHHNPLCDELRASWELTLPFGKFRGKRVSDVPLDYLRWVLENRSSLDSDLRQAIQNLLKKKR